MLPWASVVGAIMALGTVLTAGVGPAQAVTPKPVISDYSGSPSTLPYTGGSVMLSADVTGASLCTFSTTAKSVSGLPITVTCSGGSASAIIAVAGNSTPKPGRVSIRLTALGSEAESSATTSVTVEPAPPKPKISNFVPNPGTVVYTGGSVTVSADVTNASLCTFSTDSTLVFGLPTTVACDTGTAATTLAVTANATVKSMRIPIELSAAGPQKSSTSSRSIILAGAPKPDISSYKASPSPVSWTGGPATLSGVVAHATTCTFSAVGAAKRAVSGLPVTVPCSSGTASANVSVAENPAKHPKTYTVALSATGSGATVTTTAVITISAVTTPPTVSDFISSPSPVAASGGQATLSATVSNAIDCTFSAKSAAVSGLPVTVPCSVGTVSANVSVAANHRSRTLSYKVKLVVHGHRRRAKANAVIIVARPTGPG